MTMQKIKLVALGTLMCGLTLGITPQATAADDEVNYQPFSLSAEAGTLGLGVSAGWRFTDHLGVRGGVNYFSYSHDGNKIEDVSYNSKLRLLSLPVGLDIYPWQNRSFHFSIGALINMNRLTAVAPAQAPGALSIPLGNSGGIDSAAIGDLRLKVEQQTFSPFISIGGNFNLNRAKSLSLGCELGVAYTGSPDVSLTRSLGPDAIDTQVAIERQKLKDKMSDYKFYPIVKVSFNYAF